MIELHVDQKEATSANTPIRWCIQPTAYAELQNRGVDDPYILLVVRNSAKGTEQRWIAPLDQVIQYIAFSSPGDNMIFATIVYSKGDRDAKSKLKKTFLKKEDGQYRLQLFNEHGVINSNLRRTIGRATINVQVDAKFFAKEPNRFERWWVNLWFKHKPINQCQFRKRRMFAYTVQPWPVIFAALSLCVIRFVIAFTLQFLWIRDVKWTAVVRPWYYDTEDLWCYGGEYGFFKENSFAFLLRPIFLLFVAGISVAIFGTGFASSFWDLLIEQILPGLLVMVLWVVIGVIAIVVIAFGFLAINRYLDWKFQRRTRTNRLLHLKASLMRKHDPESAVPDPLTCGKLTGASLDQLPPEKRTIALRRQKLVAKVCKPYAS